MEETESQSVLWQTLDLAEKAGRSMQKEIEGYEELFDRIEEQRSAQDKVSGMLQARASDISVEMDEDSLLKELEELEVSSVED